MRTILFYTGILFLCLITMPSCKKKTEDKTGSIWITSVTVGTKELQSSTITKDVPSDTSFCIRFSSPVDTASSRNGITIKRNGEAALFCEFSYSNSYQTVWVRPVKSLPVLTEYSLIIANTVKGAGGQSFIGSIYNFITVNGKMLVKQITVNGKNFSPPVIPSNIDFKAVLIEVQFSTAIDTNGYAPQFMLSGNIPLTVSLSQDHTTVTVQNKSDLTDISRYFFGITSALKAANGYTFSGFSNSFYTSLDSTYKFPPLSDDALLTLVQQQTLKYFVDFAHPACGMARERNTSGDVVATGGSGFGVMGLLVGMNRGFITRDQGLTQFGKILTFLETCDRFHGAWPHWANGNTGHVVPFGPKDDGGDIVETSYMVMGLYTIRQYLDSTNTAEKILIQRINTLVNGVDYNWYTQGQNVLYWNWSPDWGFAVNTKVEGYNETLITYVVAAASTTHGISPDAYHQGYAHNGGIMNGNTYYGYMLPLGEPYGGPLFFTQYTYLGLDPRNLNDIYANYWQQNVNQSLINYSYCAANPHKWIGYSTSSWGLTASDNPWGYYAQSPTHDLGVISPTAAVSALPYAPVQSMNAIRHFYFILGNRLWGTYGFYDAFDVTEGWWASSYIAIDEGPIVGMIENYRTQLLWNLFMSCPEIQQGLTKLGFTYK